MARPVRCLLILFFCFHYAFFLVETYAVFLHYRVTLICERFRVLLLPYLLQRFFSFRLQLLYAVCRLSGNL